MFELGLVEIDDFGCMLVFGVFVVGDFVYCVSFFGLMVFVLFFVVVG